MPGAGWRHARRPLPGAAQSLRTARKEAIAPSVQILAAKPQLAPEGAHVLARQNPADYSELELSAKNTGGRFGLGHPFSYRELSLIFRVSLLGCTPGKITGKFENL